MKYCPTCGRPYESREHNIKTRDYGLMQDDMKTIDTKTYNTQDENNGLAKSVREFCRASRVYYGVSLRKSPFFKKDKSFVNSKKQK